MIASNINLSSITPNIPVYLCANLWKNRYDTQNRELYYWTSYAQEPVHFCQVAYIYTMNCMIRTILIKTMSWCRDKLVKASPSIYTIGSDFSSELRLT